MPARRTVSSSVLAALTAAVVAASVIPAQAADDSWRVPAGSTVTVVGHGYGHGHGMSQYGAEGAAREGLGYDQIADFYYPGTEWAKVRGRIRVLLTGDTTDDLVVLAQDGLRVRDASTGEAEVLPDNGATRWRIIVGPGGANRVGWLDKTGWHGYEVLGGEGSFSAGRQPVTLVTPSGNHAYRGRLVAAQTSPGSRDRNTVNVLPLDAYLRGVVPLEMPALWHAEAVKAQAVAARTYAAYERDHPASYYHLCDTGSCQVYGGVDAEHPASDTAVRATAHQVLTYDGSPAFTQFGSSSGGWTSAGSVPYLPAQADPYDDWAGNPVHDWKVSFAATTIAGHYPALGRLRRIEVTRRDGNGDWGGRLVSLTLVGSQHDVVVSGDTFRATFGLRSTLLTFQVH